MAFLYILLITRSPYHERKAQQKPVIRQATLYTDILGVNFLPQEPGYKSLYFNVIFIYKY
jgi:hypothetical protein